MSRRSLYPLPKGPGIKQRKWFSYVMLFVLALVLGFTSLLLGAGKYGLPMFYAYFSEPLIIILNLVPPVLIIYLFYFLTGRAWAAYLITSVFSVILAIIDYLKIQIRGDPFVASDFSLVTEAGNIVSSYEITLNWKLPLAVFVIIAGTVFAAMLLKAKPGRAAFRITALILTVAASAAVYKTVYTREFIYNAAKNTEYEYNIWSDQETFISKGFIYPFIYSIRDAIVLSPDGYSAKEAAALLSEHESADIPDDKKVNIISVMLESYADLSRFDCIELAKDVYGPWHELQKESVSGTLLSNVFAAGTINTERAFLTGYSQQDNFSKNTNSFVWYLKDQGYYTEGLHNGEDWFYDRDDINRRLGFENYYFLQSFEYSNRTDAFFFKTLREMYDSRDENVPYFSYNLTYQNHGAYDDTETCETSYIEKDGLTDAGYNILNNYLSGIHDTTVRIDAFVDSFRDEKEPVVLVFFGDHMPWLGNDDSVYHELGINIDLGTVEGMTNYYSTPYLIWANDAAKEILGNDFTGDGGTMSPCYLMEKVFSLCSWQGNEYMSVLRETKETLDIMSDSGWMRENGEFTLALSDEAQKIYDDYEKISFYVQHNFSY